MKDNWTTAHVAPAVLEMLLIYNWEKTWTIPRISVLPDIHGMLYLCFFVNDLLSLTHTVATDSIEYLVIYIQYPGSRSCRATQFTRPVTSGSTFIIPILPCSPLSTINHDLPSVDLKSHGTSFFICSCSHNLEDMDVYCRSKCSFLLIVTRRCCSPKLQEYFDLENCPF
jgi:hypothetical protein